MEQIEGADRSIRANQRITIYHEDRFLIGWKEICSYLRVSRSQALRWFINKGLPVIRLGRRVRSTTRLIDVWLLQAGTMR